MGKFTKKFVTIGAALAALVGTSLVVGLDALPASAVSTSVTSVSLAPTTTIEQSTQVWTVNFTPATSVATNGTIYVTLSAGFEASSSTPTLGSLTGLGTCTAAASGTTTITITLTGSGCLTASTAVSFTITSIVSPSTAAVYSADDFSVSTSGDITPVPPASAETVVFGTSTHLVFTQDPNSSSAGVDFSFQPVVSIEDSGNNVVISDASSVKLTITTNPGSGTLTCGTNPLAASGGVATFSGCNINDAGDGYVLTATDGTLGAANTPPFNIIGPPDKLVYTQGPTSVGVAPATQTIQVSIEDTFGNVVNVSDEVALTIDSNPGSPTPGVLACTANTVFAVAGIATFSNCSISEPGTGYTLEANDSTHSLNSPLVSPAFNVGSVIPTVTTTAPTSVTTTSAVLNGYVVTGGAAQTCYFFYGTNPTVTLDSTTGSVSAGSVGTEPVSIGVGSLTPGATYYYALDCNGVQGNTVSFIATPVSGIVVTTTATPVGSTTATLNGTDNPGGVAQTCYYLYGTSSVLSGAAATASVLTSAVTYAVSVPINVTTLTPSTQYFFELVCSNGSGGILSFTTSSGGLAVTSTATPVGSTTATLNGTDYPGGVAQTCHYLYGTSSVLSGAASTGSVVTSAVSSAVSVPINVTGLTPSTLYYFELVCTNGTGAILSFTTSATGTPLPIQIYGTDAIGTSIAISQAEFPAGGSAGGVVLARDDFFSDALVGGPLAAAINGPLLLTQGAPESATIDARTLAEIQRVLPVGGNVYILGGNLAINPNVDNTLRGLGYTVIREAGADLYATAVDVAETLGNPTTIFEATGTNFYDALSAAPAAIKENAAILLTDGPTESLETYVYLVGHPGDTRYAIGGPLEAAGADTGATAVYGQDLFSTSAAVASTFFPNATIFGLATWAEFPDALGGGVFMATGGRMGPLLLVYPNAPLPSEIVPYLNSLPVGAQGYVFGGPLAIGSSVLTAAQAAVG